MGLHLILTCVVKESVSPNSDLTATATFLGKFACQSFSLWCTLPLCCNATSESPRPALSMISEIFRKRPAAGSLTGDAIGSSPRAFDRKADDTNKPLRFRKPGTAGGSCWMSVTSRMLEKRLLKQAVGEIQ